MAQGKAGAWAIVLLAAAAACGAWWYSRHASIHPVTATQPSNNVAQASSDGSSASLDLGGGVKLEMVRISAGEFWMGSPETEEGRDADSESPRHQVKIARDFFMGKFSVTQDQWIALMKNTQSAFKDRGDLPAEQVSWDDCLKFCQMASQRTGFSVRLPSEAEWEYACRAGTAGAFYFGDALSSTQANFDGVAPYGGAAPGPKREKTTPVGTFKPNAFGLYDMHGNVWQWCRDVFHKDYNGAPADGSAWMSGGDDPNVHVYRGGSWSNEGANCRSAIRYAADHDLRTNVLGFRVVADVPAGH